MESDILKTLITFFKGLLYGISNLIPGLSGGTMAVITGVYEKLIKSKVVVVRLWIIKI